MNYRTELMDTILTSPQGQKIINYLSPIYGEAYVCLWIFQAIGLILDEGETFPEEFIDQVTPKTATWSLEFWEKEYDIVPDPGWTIEQRRINLKQKIVSRRPINPRRIEDLVSDFYGFETIVEENSAKNTFTIHIRGQVDDLEAIRASIDEIKPAHLIYIVRVSEIIESHLEHYETISASEQETYNAVVIMN